MFMVYRCATCANSPVHIKHYDLPRAHHQIPFENVLSDMDEISL